MKLFLRHLSSFIAPIVMGILLPYLILRSESQSFTRPLITTTTGLLLASGMIGMAGLIFFLLTVRMFILIGNGTIMPWDPSRRLITGSLYAHVRNPMILSLLLILAGQAVLFTSWGIAILAVLFFVVNTVYFIFSEEPGLEKRFGEEYIQYKRNVPRWIPRWKPWKPF